ncbi:MAG: dephospho-CoA kinase [Alphaproteobacteria bacterium]
MIVLGLTGSIGMGKTHAARVLRRMGLPVFEADGAVHRLIGPGGRAVAAVDAAFPGVVRGGAVDHAALGERVFGDQRELARLEAILHPLVRAAQRRFLRQAALRGADMVVLDIPLLFETGADRLCDATILVTAPPFVQEARVLGRPGMTRARLAAIRARQMAESDKRRRADFIVPTGLSKGETLNRLRRIVTLMRAGGKRG